MSQTSALDSSRLWSLALARLAQRVGSATYDGFLRNVAVALGNWGTAEAAAALRTRLDTPSPLVREHVAWALEQCGRAAAAVPPAREQDG